MVGATGEYAVTRKTRGSRLQARLKEWETAAECGRAEALYDLGLYYSTGQDVDRDYIAAHKWLNLAALKGEKRAIQDRDELAREMTRSDIREALRQARMWMQTH